VDAFYCNKRGNIQGRNCNNGTKDYHREREHLTKLWKKKSGMQRKIEKKREGNKYLNVY